MITRQTGHQMKYIWNVSVFLHITFTSVERKDEFRCIIMRNNLCRIIYRRSVAYVKWHGNLICQLCIVSCLITCTDIDKCYFFSLSLWVNYFPISTELFNWLLRFLRNTFNRMDHSFGVNRCREQCWAGKSIRYDQHFNSIKTHSMLKFAVTSGDILCHKFRALELPRIFLQNMWCFSRLQ